IEMHEALLNASRDGKCDEVKQLLKEGTPIDVPNLHSPLIYAAHNGRRQVVQYLLEAGADVNVRDEDGTAIENAEVKGHYDIAADIRTFIESQKPDHVSLFRNI